MLNDFKLNHIGIAVPDMEKSKEKYLKDGFKVLKENYDENFLTNLCLMKKDNQIIELVYTDNINSKAYSMCQKEEETIYHKCYEVKNLEEVVKKLKDDKYIQISNIVYSNLLLGKVCFLYSKEKGLLELLEV